MKSATRTAASALGVYAGLLGAVHGYFEVLQGNVATGGVMINALGPPCQPDAVAHACYPAMTLVPNFLMTGILAIVAGLTTAIWAVGFVQRRRGRRVLTTLAVAMLLVGGGFVPMFTGLIASFAVSKVNAPPARWHEHKIARGLAKAWPWALVAYFAWVLPVQWMLGRFLGSILLNAGMILLLFDLGLALLAVFAARAHDVAETSLRFALN